MTRSTPALGARPHLADEVASHIRDLIMSGQLQPGEFIRLDRIAEELGVSVTPVREALQALRAEDMVLLEPRRGYLVSPLHRQDLEDLFRMQSELTGELVVRATKQLSEGDLRTLAGMHAEIEQTVTLPSAPGLALLEHQFHREINRLAQSRKLAWLLGHATRYLPQHFYVDNPEWRTAMLRDHAELIEAFQTRDADRARAAMQRHVEDGRARLLRHLETTGMWGNEMKTGKKS
jgi:DNA-binding GntR family transcriptional regulator